MNTDYGTLTGFYSDDFAWNKTWDQMKQSCPPEISDLDSCYYNCSDFFWDTTVLLSVQFVGRCRGELGKLTSTTKIFDSGLMVSS